MDRNEWINRFQDRMRQAAPGNPLQNYVLTRERPAGEKLSASVSPCVWLYDKPFQISVTLAGGGSTIVTDSHLKFAEATEADVARLLDSVHLKKCRSRGCRNPAFDPASTSVHREGRCEQCFMKVLDRELEKAQAAEKKRLARLDRQYRARGFTHRVDTWIHAEGGDRQLSIWVADPTEDTICRELLRSGADPAEGYTVHAL